MDAGRKKKHKRKCRVCRKRAWPNYFYCLHCHSQVGKADEVEGVSEITGTGCSRTVGEYKVSLNGDSLAAGGLVSHVWHNIRIGGHNG